jgi:hypothetical protein
VCNRVSFLSREVSYYDGNGFEEDVGDVGVVGT